MGTPFEVKDINISGGAVVFDPVQQILFINSSETGNLNFPDDAGAVSWINMPFHSTTTTIGTEESYTAQLNDRKMFTVYGESDGLGGLQNPSLKFGNANSKTVWYIGTGDGCSAWVFDTSNKFPIITRTSTSKCNE